MVQKQADGFVDAVKSIDAAKAAVAGGVGGLGGFIYDRYIRGKKDLKSNLLYGLGFGGAGALAYSAYDVASKMLSDQKQVDMGAIQSRNQATNKQKESAKRKEPVIASVVAPDKPDMALFGVGRLPNHTGEWGGVGVIGSDYDKATTATEKTLSVLPETAAVATAVGNIPSILNPEKHLHGMYYNVLDKAKQLADARIKRRFRGLSYEAAQEYAKNLKGIERWGTAEIGGKTIMGPAAKALSDELIARAHYAESFGNGAAVNPRALRKAIAAAQTSIDSITPALKNATELVESTKLRAESADKSVSDAITEKNRQKQSAGGKKNDKVVNATLQERRAKTDRRAANKEHAAAVQQADALQKQYNIEQRKLVSATDLLTKLKVLTKAKSIFRDPVQRKAVGKALLRGGLKTVGVWVGLKGLGELGRALGAKD